MERLASWRAFLPRRGVLLAATVLSDVLTGLPRRVLTWGRLTGRVLGATLLMTTTLVTRSVALRAGAEIERAVAICFARRRIATELSTLSATALGAGARNAVAVRITAAATTTTTAASTTSSTALSIAFAACSLLVRSTGARSSGCTSSVRRARGSKPTRGIYSRCPRQSGNIGGSCWICCMV